MNAKTWIIYNADWNGPAYVYAGWHGNDTSPSMKMFKRTVWGDIPEIRGAMEHALELAKASFDGDIHVFASERQGAGIGATVAELHFSPDQTPPAG